MNKYKYGFGVAEVIAWEGSEGVVRFRRKLFSRESYRPVTRYSLTQHGFVVGDLYETKKEALAALEEVVAYYADAEADAEALRKSGAW